MLADKIAEVRTDSLLNICGMDKSTSSNPALSTNPRKDLSNPLRQEVVALRQHVTELIQQFQRLSHGRSYNRSRTRSNFWRNTSKSLEREGSSEICYYHSKFSKDAMKCRSPCSCTRNNNQGKLKSAVAVSAAYKPTAIRSSLIFVFDKKTRLKFLVDSCSDVNCLPLRLNVTRHRYELTTKKLNPEPLQLFAANNSNILTYGSKLLNIDLGLRRNFSWKFDHLCTNTNNRSKFFRKFWTFD
ncbi:hypothetical protein TNCV_1350821 [Trichonephila clavipes]|nr:hypothetical protein TNCV_1350821 [Trichonephila clavipes]